MRLDAKRLLCVELLMGNAQAAARESVCVCARALDEQNAEEELSAEKRHSIQHTHTLREV